MLYYEIHEVLIKDKPFSITTFPKLLLHFTKLKNLFTRQTLSNSSKSLTHQQSLQVELRRLFVVILDFLFIIQVKSFWTG